MILQKESPCHLDLAIKPNAFRRQNKLESPPHEQCKTIGTACYR